MISIVKYPDAELLKQILTRPSASNDAVLPLVQGILNNVQQNGDAALRDYNKQFDNYMLPALEVTADEWKDGVAKVSAELKEAIGVAIQNIATFHSAQQERNKMVTTAAGVQCWRKSVGIERVGIYIPGGTAPLFSTLLMLAVPANIAGCKEIIMCTPPDKNGEINAAILYAAKQTGVNRIFKAGGAQAIAGMAYGTDTIPKVYKIFGPGNQYVTAAKLLVQSKGVAIDLPAGPSEVAILADDSCIPAFVAADLLAQAEHGPDSQVVLVSESEAVITAVIKELEQQLSKLPRKETAALALKNSKAILVNNLKEGLAVINEYAPEHLIMVTQQNDDLADEIINAGSVFLGNYTPESAGDYASGTNHTLPTNGYAKAYSGVSLDSFVKKITFQHITEDGLKNISKTVTNMALAEGLSAHAASITIRTEKISNE